jgi:hypothetical protein
MQRDSMSQAKNTQGLKYGTDCIINPAWGVKDFFIKTSRYKFLVINFFIKTSLRGHVYTTTYTRDPPRNFIFLAYPPARSGPTDRVGLKILVDSLIRTYNKNKFNIKAFFINISLLIFIVNFLHLD